MKRIITKLAAAIITAALAFTIAPFAAVKNLPVAAAPVDDNTYVALGDFYDSATAFLVLHYEDLPADVIAALENARARAWDALRTESGMEAAMSNLRVQLRCAQCALAGIPADTNIAPDYVIGTNAYNRFCSLTTSAYTAGIVGGIYATHRGGDITYLRTLLCQNYVERLYINILGRTPDLAGRDAWVNGIMNGTYDANDVAFALLNSQEFVSRNLSSGEYMTVLYRTFLDREPDAAGLANWTNALNNNVITRAEVASFFATQSSWNNILSIYGLD